MKLADKLSNLVSMTAEVPQVWKVAKMCETFWFAKEVTEQSAPAHPGLGKMVKRLFEAARIKTFERDGEHFTLLPLADIDTQKQLQLNKDEQERLDSVEPLNSMY